MKTKVLIIDDENLFGETLSQELNETEKYDSIYIDSPNHFKDIKNNFFHLILIDLRLKNTSGLNHIEEAILLWPDAKLYMMTGFGSIASAVSAIKLGATDYLTKPITIEKIDKLNVHTLIEKDDTGQQDPLSLDRIEREYIEHILVQENGNISKAAEKLGLHRQSLQRKLKKWVPFK